MRIPLSGVTLPTLVILAAAVPVAAQDPVGQPDTAGVPILQDSAAADTTALDSAALGGPGQDPLEAVTEERAALDETIRNQLQAVFDRVSGLAGVEVSVDAGVVTLQGTVLSAGTRDQAGALAAGMDGVLFVDNRIRESTSLEEQLQPTWSRLRSLGYSAVAKLPLLLVALLIVGLASVLGGLLARWRGPSFLQTRNPFLQNLIRHLIQGTLVVAGVVVALDLLDATALVGAVVGTAGLAGLALGFAFKDIVENYLAGTILAFRQPFSKNDHILVESYEGKVVRLTARETILMTLDGNHVRVPNALVFRSPMVNYSRNPLRRFQFDAGLGSGDDLARAREVGVMALSDMEGVLPDPAPQVLVMELGDSTVTVRFMGWVDQRAADFARVRSEAIRVVKSRLEGAGLTLPSPEYLIQLGRQGAAEPQPEAPAAPAPGPAPTDVTRDDVAVDRSVDEQIEADRRASDEGDLLDRTSKGS